MTTENARLDAEKVDTSGLDQAQTIRFWELAKDWGLTVANNYRRVSLKMPSEPRGNLGLRVSHESITKALKAALANRTKDNPLSVAEAKQLLGAQSKLVSSGLIHLYKTKKAERVEIPGKRVRYGYYQTPKKSCRSKARGAT